MNIAETVRLTCDACGITWARPRQPGKRPKKCPECREAPRPLPLSTLKACAACGVTFRKQGDTRYCDGCRPAYRAAEARRRSRERNARARTERVCGCGTAFVATYATVCPGCRPPAHAPVEVPCMDCGALTVSRNGGRPKRCDPCRRVERAASTRAAMAKHTAETGQTHRERYAETYRAQAARRWAALKAEGRTRRQTHPEEMAAHDALRRARELGAATGAPIRRSEILDRDGWACGLCGDPIDPALTYPAPGSASLDHIIPLTRGGAHDPGNLQAAHLACNVRKGNRLESVPSRREERDEAPERAAVDPLVGLAL